ncbi:hypothetical protein FS749_016375 [Ceratobasidium sp. UAMH 11750]|nr:hypothetical protein FS749_016375 [Ceratobasidium sp. UAMH 11750]
MASSGHQPEGFSTVDFNGEHIEFGRMFAELSTFHTHIANSFRRMAQSISYPVKAGSPPRPSSYPAPEHVGALLATAPGAMSLAQGPEPYYRPSYSRVNSPMLPPAMPTYYPSGFLSSHPSASSSMHGMPRPPPSLLQRTGSATSGLGQAGSHETTSHSQHPPQGEISASEHTSPSKPTKRKRAHQTEPVEPGNERNNSTTMGGSTPQEAAEAEIDQPRQPVRGSEDLEASRMSGAQPGAEGARAVDRPMDPAGGPSIVVFASGTGTSRPRTALSRSYAPLWSSKARKEKKPRDPKAPKQPPPAYIVYQNEIREVTLLVRVLSSPLSCLIVCRL